MNEFWNGLYIPALALLGIGCLFGLIRAIRGPRTADRVVGINIINTLATVSLAVLALLLKEAWLLDVCLIYALVGSLSVVVLTTLHTAASRRAGKEEKHD